MANPVPMTDDERRAFFGDRVPGSPSTSGGVTQAATAGVIRAAAPLLPALPPPPPARVPARSPAQTPDGASIPRWMVIAAGIAVVAVAFFLMRKKA
jgi:hypothetical protein